MFKSNRGAWQALFLAGILGVLIAGSIPAEEILSRAQKIPPSGVVVPPVVVSIAPVTISPTNIEEVEFRATFSEPVFGVDTTDFILDSHNLAGEFITGVSGSLNVYTITVHSGNGEGVMDVDLADDDSIKDLDGNPLGGPGLGNGDYYNNNMLVIDRRGPQITLSVNTPWSIECGSGPFSPPIATAMDGLDGDVSENLLVTGSVDPDTVESYSLVYTVDDSLGNHSEEILTVHVQDTSNPVIFLTGENPLAWPCGVPYADPGATVSDQCDETPLVIIDATAVHVEASGNYSVYVTVRDGSGNESHAERTVVVPAPCGSQSDVHAADQDGDGQISLSELLRVIQFFNSDGYHCDTGGEDGYSPGPGDTSCTAHHSDYNPQDWRVGLSELLRIIQFFNSSGYHSCPGEGTEDGFCPGVP